jgi:hypothetical protein
MQLSDGYLKILSRILSCPALLPHKVDLSLAGQAKLVMPELACASSLECMALQFECGGFTDSLPLKGHEDRWPHLRKLVLAGCDSLAKRHTGTGYKELSNAAAWVEAIRGLRDHPTLQSFRFFWFGQDDADELEAACEALRDTKNKVQVTYSDSDSRVHWLD